MEKKRLPIPRKLRDAILVKFNHRCACCDAPYHEVHHRDGDTSNNTEVNLVVLCPNCHQGKVHGNSIKITSTQMKLYEMTKNRVVFKPVYNAIESRINFITTDAYENLTSGEISQKSRDLINFVTTLKHGAYYAQELKGLLSRSPSIFSLSAPDYVINQQEKKIEEEHKKKIKANKRKILELIAECLSVQM